MTGFPMTGVVLAIAALWLLVLPIMLADQRRQHRMTPAERYAEDADRQW